MNKDEHEYGQELDRFYIGWAIFLASTVGLIGLIIGAILGAN